MIKLIKKLFKKNKLKIPEEIWYNTGVEWVKYTRQNLNKQEDNKHG